MADAVTAQIVASSLDGRTRKSVTTHGEFVKVKNRFADFKSGKEPWSLGHLPIMIMIDNNCVETKHDFGATKKSGK